MDTRLHRNPCGNREAWQETDLHRTVPPFRKRLFSIPAYQQETVSIDTPE
jgi:hypothetical protein